TSYFDTTISLKLYHTSSDDYDIEDIFTYFEETISLYHQYMDKYHPYDDINNVYTINHSDGPVVLDPILFDAIEYALVNENIILVENTPLFNIALNPVLDIWHDARESDSCDYSIESGIAYCEVPKDLIDGQSFNTNPADIVLDDSSMTISFLKENMSIDLGGMSKGYVSQIIADHLNDLGVKFLLNNGNSNIVAGGVNPNNVDGLYYIALTKPSTDAEIVSSYFIYLKIPEDMAVVSSGNYQRFFKGIDDHLVYHHIIDPFTYYPGGDSMSVTIIYPDSGLSDILSTAIYLLDQADALAFVESYPDLEAIWYDYNGTYTYSSGFEQYIYTP
nr:FAD:protein FMN transferase [Bacillota bacterium]